MNEREQKDRTVTLYGITAQMPERLVDEYIDGAWTWQAGSVLLRLDPRFPGDVHLYACAAAQEHTDPFKAAPWAMIAERAKKEMDDER